jgi:hypothetical protein
VPKVWVPGDVAAGLEASSDGFCGIPGFEAVEELLQGLDFQNAKPLPPLWQPTSPRSAIPINA